MRKAPTAHWHAHQVELFLLEPHDVTDSYAGWLNDPEVNRYLESRFVPHDIASVRDFVGGVLADSRALLLGIRALGRHVGNIKLAPIEVHHGLGEVGIMIGEREAWGRGLGSEAIRCVATIAAQEFGLRKLTAGCYASNVGSAKAFQKAGFHVEGVRPRHFLLDGRPEDLILMAQFLDAGASAISK
ncbi:MAG: GNAT family N-acetyltransferase [Vicinamibacterales bacterium]